MAEQKKKVAGAAGLAGMIAAEKVQVAKLVAPEPTTADRIGFIESKADGKLFRLPLAKDRIRVWIEDSGGNRLAADGRTTLEAVVNLARILGWEFEADRPTDQTQEG